MTTKIKLNDRGGQGSPLPPIPGLTPIAATYSDADLKADHEAAAQAANETVEGKWPHWLFEELGVDSDPGPILTPMIERVAKKQNVSFPVAATRLVGMDSPLEIALEYHNYIIENNLPLHKSHRLEAPDSINDDVVSKFMGLSSYLLRDIHYAAYITFAEKAYWESEDGYGKSTRPEFTAQESGVAPCRSTAYQVGCPPFADIWQGHVMFHTLIAARAARAINGRGVDKMFLDSGMHGGAYRIMAYVHGPISAKEGYNFALDFVKGKYKSHYAHIDAQFGTRG